MVVMALTVGITKSVRIVLQYPALLMTPVFSYWTFGDMTGLFMGNAKNNLKISFKLTWGNVIITLMGNLGLLVAHSITKPLTYTWRGTTRPEDSLHLHLVSASCFVVSVFTLLILQKLQSCQRFCCACWQTDSVFKKTSLDPRNPSELIFISYPATGCETNDLSQSGTISTISNGHARSMATDDNAQELSKGNSLKVEVANIREEISIIKQWIDESLQQKVKDRTNLFQDLRNIGIDDALAKNVLEMQAMMNELKMSISNDIKQMKHELELTQNDFRNGERVMTQVKKDLDGPMKSLEQFLVRLTRIEHAIEISKTKIESLEKKMDLMEGENIIWI